MLYARNFSILMCIIYIQSIKRQYEKHYKESEIEVLVIPRIQSLNIFLFSGWALQ